MKSGGSCFIVRGDAYFRARFKTLPISPLMQKARSWSCFGMWDCWRLIQIYVEFGLSAAMRQKGYLMMPGVLFPTPSSKNKHPQAVVPAEEVPYTALRLGASLHPLRNGRSARRFMVMGLPQLGQRGTQLCGYAACPSALPPCAGQPPRCHRCFDWQGMEHCHSP